MAHSLATYLALIDGLGEAGWKFHPIREYFVAPAAPPCVYLRHDVDRFPGRAIAMAEAEATRGLRATYYFRCDASARFPADAMRQIADLGHEVGFHYESLSRCQGDTSAALDLFGRELDVCRGIVVVDTVSPHGAPLSQDSNMDFVERLCPDHFRLLGDATTIDFGRTLYVTDTGGIFGSRHNFRDRVEGRALLRETHPRQLARYLIDHNETQIVLSCHPERWPSGALGLLQAIITDFAVNAVKSLVTRAS